MIEVVLLLYCMYLQQTSVHQQLHFRLRHILL